MRPIVTLDKRDRVAGRRFDLPPQHPIHRPQELPRILILQLHRQRDLRRRFGPSRGRGGAGLFSAGAPGGPGRSGDRTPL